MQNTTNYNLNKPDGNDFAKIASLNENADIIDAKLKELEDSESAFVQHANDQQIHVTQAKQEYWNGFLLRNGGVLNGQVNYNSLNTNCIYQVATIDGATGAPPESYGTLVYFHVPNTDYGYQEFTSVINQTRYLRITSSGT